MNTSLNWIKAMVPGLEVTDQEFRDAMTLSGTKVENFTAFDKNLDKIVVGQIESVEKHPDADKLVICQVNVGSETVQIVTGAPNIPVGSSGQKVPVVLDGGRVAGGHDGGALPEDGIKIKKGKLRGVESFGMMCAIEELGSSREFYPDAPENGIYILGDDAQVEKMPFTISVWMIPYLNMKLRKQPCRLLQYYRHCKGSSGNLQKAVYTAGCNRNRQRRRH